MAQLKDLLVAGPGRVLNDLYVQSSIYVTNGIKIGSANELKSFGTGLSLSSAGVLSASNNGTVTQIVAGTGLTGGTITTSGTIAVNFAGTGSATTVARSDHTHSYLPLSGGTMTGTLTVKANVYDDTYTGALNMANSNIYGLNAIYFADASEAASEGIHFYRSGSVVDSLYAKSGKLYFTPNRTLGQAGTDYEVITTLNYISNFQTNNPIYFDTNNKLSLRLRDGAPLQIETEDGSLTVITGTIAGTVATGNHTHGFTVTSSSSTADYTLAASTKYSISVGGTTKVIQTPPNSTYSFASGKGTTDGFTVNSTTYSVGNLRANEDKRSVATTPSTYYIGNGCLRFLGLKNNSTLGISDAGTYSTALGLSPWGDTSGGDAFEFAFNTKGVWMRHGTSTWGNWATLLTSADLRISEIDIDGNTLTIYDQNGDDRQYSPSFSNSYHTTGSWNGLTYTATAVGGAGALAFTIPTGSTSTTVSRGDHTHTNMVTGSGLTANEFVVGNGSSGIKTATVATIQTKLGLGSLAYVSPSTSGTGTTLFLSYSQDDGTYSLADPSSDHLVNQVNSNNNVAYRVLLSYSDSNSTQINLAYKNSGLTFNPSTGTLSSAKIETGSAATSYFQSQRFRGEGDAATYYHAVDFGYAGHDRVDFYEYGGIYCFHKHTAAAVGSGDTVLGTITANGWEGNVVGNVTGTASGNALTSHTHGYITNIGALGSNASVSSVATGDALVIMDASDSSKISYLGATLNTTHGGSFLRRDGTWAVPPATSGVTAIRQNNGSGTEYTNVKLTFSGATINMSNNVVLVTIDGTCLMEGTKILMADRTEKNVEDVVEGDLIMSYDPNAGEMCEAIVIANLGTGVSDDFVNYYFDDGSFVTIFGKHCLYNSDMGTARGVDFWEPGWKCINSSGEEITYIGSEDITHVGRKRHFDLRSSNMLYFANGVLNANALTANNMLVKRSGFEFPQSYLDAIQEDADSSARLNTFKFDKTIGSRLVPILKELREQKKILDDNKKLLADTDYIVAKFTEGLISTVEWLKAKADRAGWRTLVNKAEEAYNTAKTRYDAFKNQYKPTSTHRERFNAAVARDNACLEALKAYYANRK